MTASTKQDFYHYRGDSQRISFDAAPESPTSIQTLTGQVVYWAAYPYIVLDPDLDDPLIEKNSDDDEQLDVLSESAMTFEVILEGIDTEDLEPGLYYHKAWILDDTNNKRTIATGRMWLLE